MRIFLFLSYSFGIETMYVHPLQFPRKLYPIPDQNGQSVYPFSDQNGRKTLPHGAAHTYIAYIREYPPPPGRLTGFGLLMVQLRYVIAYVFTLKTEAINFYSMCLFTYSELFNCFFSPTSLKRLKNLRHRIYAEDVSQAKLRCISPRKDIPYDIV